MFLQLTFGLLMMQIIAILIMILPIPTRIKNYFAQIMISLSENFVIRTILLMLVIMGVGLFMENGMSAYKYDRLYEQIHLTSPISGINEILLKLFRAQRNMYLTFFVNFNWIVIYGFYKFIKKICDRATTKNI